MATYLAAIVIEWFVGKHKIIIILLLLQAVLSFKICLTTFNFAPTLLTCYALFLSVHCR